MQQPFENYAAMQEYVLHQLHSKLEDSYADIIEKPQPTYQKLRQALSQLDHVTGIALILNRRSEIAFINQQGMKLIDSYTPQVIGKSWINHFIPSNQKTEMRLVLEQVIRGQTKPFNAYLNHIQATNGKIINTTWENTFIKNSNDEIIGSFSYGLAVGQ
ncbi:hypothetical protein ACUR5C_15740 [Aliikangiella sp. IMCC44653]